MKLRIWDWLMKQIRFARMDYNSTNFRFQIWVFRHRWLQLWNSWRSSAAN